MKGRGKTKRYSINYERIYGKTAKQLEEERVKKIKNSFNSQQNKNHGSQPPIGKMLKELNQKETGSADTLKTLKDILGKRTANYCVSVHKLKAEAVKWVKAKKSVYIDAEKFFNLTEEDLK